MKKEFIGKKICFLGASNLSNGLYVYNIRSYMHNQKDRCYVFNRGTGGNRMDMAFDIIQEEIDFNSKMTDGVFKYKVYWDEEELCWCLEHIGNESIHHELWQCNQSTEVIGNIHENPELLGKEK